MIKLIDNPNLPVNRVKHCLIGEQNKEEIYELTQLDINCIELKASKLLDSEINSHADILSFNFGNGQVIVNNGSTGESELKKSGIDQVIFNNTISSPYPNDIPLNVAFIGNNMVGNAKYMSKEIIEFAKKNDINIINTKQGYARCNLCIVSEKAVITEDAGIAYLLKNCQFDVLHISAGDIHLSESHYGFLGGASSKLSKNEIYFSGNIEEHRNYSEIIGFLEKHNVKAVYNKNRFLRDFGGIIQLTESI